MYLWTRKSQLNFESHPDVESGSELRIRTGFASLAEVCALRVLSCW